MSNTGITPGAAALAVAGALAGAAIITPLAAVTNGPDTGAFLWNLLPLSAAGAAAPSLPPFAQGFNTVSFIAQGVFGSGGTLTFEGSNDGVTWSALSVPAALSAPGVTAPINLRAGPLYIRPHATTGDSTTAITVTALMS